MRRRDLLTVAPAAALLAQGNRSGAAAGPGAVAIVTMGHLHPRVETAVSDLIACLQQHGYNVTRNAPGARVPRVVIGVANRDNQAALQAAGAGPVELLPPEHYRLHARPGLVTALGGDAKGLVYALSELRRAVGLHKALPASLRLERKPVFPIRRWSTSVSHDFGSPWDERHNLAQRLAYIESDVLKRAADYGMNSVEINGRPGDGWDIAWIVGFENYPKLAGLYPEGERAQRVELVERLARASQRNLLSFYVWSHELYLPPGFAELYPQVKGTGYPVCLSNEFLKKFIRDKYVEFFQGCPSVDGLVMSVNESGNFKLLTDEGCKCDRCARMSQHDRLSAILNEVIAVCSRLHKRIVLRTFQNSSTHDLYGHPELDTIRKAYTGLPPQVEIMSKYCPLDFYGGAIADEPLIGAFPNPHLVEFSLDVEWQGRTFVPALTPENFKRRIAHAIDKRCAGIVPRIDFPFPGMEPEPIFGHPNEFNAWYMGELLWNPATDIDDSLLRWAKLRYGAEAAPAIAPALRKTEAITQQTFFCQGQILISYHNMIGGVSQVDEFLWGQALSKWDPGKRKLSETFFHPDEQLIAAAKQEKAAAGKLAADALEEIRAARPKLSPVEYQRLVYWFEKLRDTAGLWGHLTELYLRHHMLGAGRDETIMPPLLEAARASLGKAIEMENRHGKNSWPVFSPDRGVTAYEFVHQILRRHIAAVTGEPVEEAIRSKDVDAVVTTPVIRPQSTESFWRALVECGRVGFQIGQAMEARIQWSQGLRQIRLEGAFMTLLGTNGRELHLPLACAVQGTALAARDAAYTVRKDVERLVLEPTRTKS